MWSYWAPGHSATLSTLAPESVPCQCPPASKPSKGGEFPVVIVPILAPGWAGTPHPRSTSTRLRGPGLGRPRAGSTSPSPRDPPAASSSRPYALPGAADPTLRLHSRWGGPTPATPRCSPSGDANGVRLPGAATQLHPHCQGKRAQVDYLPQLNLFDQLQI